jgi:hypothetical protein
VGIKLSTEFLNKWKHILSDVEKTDIPTHLIDKITIRLLSTAEQDELTQVINISLLKEQGHEAEEIEDIINETLYELNDFIDSVDFFLDIDAIAQEVQPETDKILNNLN